MDLNFERDKLDLLLRTWEALAKGDAKRIASGLVDRRRPGALSLDAGALARLGHLFAAPTETGGVTWRRLPQIRAAAMDALTQLESERNSRWARKRGELLLPSDSVTVQPPSLGPRQRLATDPTSLLQTTYPYWDIRPPPAENFHQHAKRIFENAPSLAGMHPLEKLAIKTVRATSYRRAVAEEFRRHCEGEVITDKHQQLLGLLKAPDTPSVRQPLAGEIDLASALYRAYKLATFARARQYLDAAYPGWEARLNIAVPFGARIESLPRNLAPRASAAAGLHDAFRGQPVPGRWVRLWRRWVEPYDFRLASRFPDLVDRIDPWLGLPTTTDEPQATARLGAIFELSAFDIQPQSTAAGVSVPLALLHWLSQIMLFDDVGSALEEQVCTTRGRGGGWQPPERTGSGSTHADAARTGSIVNSDALRRLREAVDLLYRGSGPEDDTLRGHFDDLEALYEWTTLLARPPAAGSEDRLEPDLRAGLTAGLIEGVGRRLQLDEPGHDRIREFMPSLQALSVTLLDTRPDELANAFRPTLEVATPATAGPYVANIYRSLAIAHSKHHRYVEALGLLAQANTWLNAARSRTPEGRQDDNWQRAATETEQQLALQGNGLHARVFEWLVSHPAYASPTPRAERRMLDELRAFSTQALESAGNALATLEALKHSFPLPSARQPDRAATTQWEVNTRLMFMRALLCRAMVHALDAADETRPAEGRQFDAGDADVLCGSVHVLYEEVTALPLTVANLCELTRICLHYAFMCRLRFLEPASERAAHLPLHLSQPGASGHFDVEAATAYLLERRNDAGVLATITYPQLRKVVDHRSRPEGWNGDSPYARWVALPETQTRLRRTFVPAQLLRTTPYLPAPVATAHLRT